MRKSDWMRERHAREKREFAHTLIDEANTHAAAVKDMTEAQTDAHYYQIFASATIVYAVYSTDGSYPIQKTPGSYRWNPICRRPNASVALPRCRACQ
jgi:hypothetical protein